MAAAAAVHAGRHRKVGQRGAHDSREAQRAAREERATADGPTAGLEGTAQAQTPCLSRDPRKGFNSAVILITHDLGVVAELADDILVMYAGRGVEYASANEIFTAPQHPYTWGLLGSMPRLDRERTERLLPIQGTPPSLINVPSGCPFHPRCSYGDLNGGASENERPELVEISPRHHLACHLSSQDRQRIWESEIKPKL